ncbi:Poly-beta-hydroxybutyrate polymerase [Bacillus sp. THAF10]|uniref:alpha/beta fold hydrolase n=1 Tax=Bacillus sp. THAF10 TaxID=2587848 RepID=UPI0012A92C25|nr:alpha/beta fold hydrolase [Bacillus sp. THAF10]QFT90364.1 Poly-beta-hydroxybutyrate polymerase [Bacillus sp. THAF10]
MSQYNDTPFKDGVTLRKAVWKKNKATLWYYPSSTKKFKTPVFITYSLINQPFILDLLPGKSTIEALVKNGFDVYLIDFGKPSLEDQQMTLSDYVSSYIHQAVQKTLQHARVEELTMIGYCLGGTLAAIYASIHPKAIKNLILLVTPIDFSKSPYFDKWVMRLRKEGTASFAYMEELGIIPSSYVKAGVRLVTTPVYFTPYISLLLKAHDRDYVEKWIRFHTWTEGHIPMTSGVAKQMMEDFTLENKLIKGSFSIQSKKAKLSNITANLLVVGTENDRLVPLHQMMPIMDKVASKDKHVHVLKGGHTAATVENGQLPSYMDDWLTSRSILASK